MCVSMYVARQRDACGGLLQRKQVQTQRVNWHAIFRYAEWPFDIRISICATDISFIGYRLTSLVEWDVKPCLTNQPCWHCESFTPYLYNPSVSQIFSFVVCHRPHDYLSQNSTQTQLTAHQLKFSVLVFLVVFLFSGDVRYTKQTPVSYCAHVNSVPTVWNSLPAALQLDMSLSVFCKRLKTFLMTHAITPVTINMTRLLYPSQVCSVQIKSCQVKFNVSIAE